MNMKEILISFVLLLCFVYCKQSINRLWNTCDLNNSYSFNVLNQFFCIKKPLWETYKKEHMPAFLDMYEKFLAENGGKFFVGDHVDIFNT